MGSRPGFRWLWPPSALAALVLGLISCMCFVYSKLCCTRVGVARGGQPVDVTREPVQRILWCVSELTILVGRTGPATSSHAITKAGEDDS
jgi:hypothetical protein